MYSIGGQEKHKLNMMALNFVQYLFQKLSDFNTAQ